MTDYELATLGTRVAAMGIAIAALLLAYVHFSVSRAAALMERFSDAAFVQMRADVDAFLTPIRHKSRQEKIEQCLRVCKREGDDARLFAQLHAISMYFSEIGVCSQSRVISIREFKLFNRLLPYYWCELAPFIIACHHHFGFGDRVTSPPQQAHRLHEMKNLVFFENFRRAFAAMLDRGIVIPPPPDAEPLTGTAEASPGNREALFDSVDYRRSEPRWDNSPPIDYATCATW